MSRGPIPGEAKLMAILDCIDNRQYRQGLKMMKTVKQQSQLLDAMKVLCLQKTGSHEAARQVALAVVNEQRGFDNETSVQMLSKCMRRMKLDSEFARELHRTCEALSWQNDFLVRYLAAEYVAMRDWPSLQKLSVKLFKKDKLPKYQVWSIMANLYQAPEGDPSAMLLVLSSKMLEKLISEKSVTQPASRDVVWTYIHCLKRMNKTEDALRYLSSEAAADAYPMEADRLALLCELYESLGNSQARNAISKHVLTAYKDERDDWAWWTAYFTTLTDLVANDPASLDTVVIPTRHGTEAQSLRFDSSFDSATAFLSDIKDLEDQVSIDGPFRRPRRAAKLATLHLTWLQVQQGASSLGNDWVQGIAAFLAMLKYKPQGHMDVAKFYPAVQKEGLAEKLVEAIGAPADSDEACTSSPEALRHKLLEYKVKIATGVFDNASDDVTLMTVQSLMNLYERSLPLSKNLEWSEKRYEDDCVHLACLVCLQKYAETTNKRWLAQCLVNLQALVTPKNNTQLQMWLLLLSPILGISRTGVAEELDIKAVMLESLAYLLHSTYLTLEPRDAASRQMARIADWHLKTVADYPEISQKAWHNALCVKIGDGDRFTRCLAGSIVRREATVEGIACNSVLDVSLNEAQMLEYLQNHVHEALESDMRVSPVFDNKDLECVAATLLCAPSTDRSNLLMNTLLSSTNATHDPQTHRLPYAVAQYQTLRAMKALLQVSTAPKASDEPKKPVKKGKDKKQSKEPPPVKEVTKVAPAVDQQAVCSDDAKAAKEAWSQIPAGALKHLADDVTAQAGTALLSAVFHLVESLSHNDSTSDDALKAVCEHLAAVAVLLESQSEPWKDSRFHDTKHIVFLFRQVLPYTTRCLRHCIGYFKLSAHVKEPAQLDDALQKLLSALGNVLASCRPFSSALKKSPSDREGAAKTLSDLTEAGAETEWCGSDKALVDLSQRAVATWSASMKRIIRFAEETESDVSSLAQDLAKK
ncbi:Phagocyte signaling-impaired protein [Diplonema papillatum]|nr:Phagocyte signaling-impaired protein [Diplonema papillatum]